MIADALSDLRFEMARAGARAHGDYVLVGGVVLWLHGLRESIEDIDGFVTPELFDGLYVRDGWYADFDDHGHPFVGWETHGVPVSVCAASPPGRWAPATEGDLVEETLDRSERVEGRNELAGLGAWPCQPVRQLHAWKSCFTEPRPKDGEDLRVMADYLGRGLAA